MNDSRLFLLAVVAPMSLLIGCLGIKSYPNDLDKNLHVRTAADSGSFFSTMRTAVDIHRVRADCTTEYEGTVQLGEGSVEVGIPSERWSRLVFVFASSSFLLNTSGTITYETLLHPRAGHEYDLTVTYEDDLYNVTIQERDSSNGARRKIQHRPLSACQGGGV